MDGWIALGLAAIASASYIAGLMHGRLLWHVATPEWPTIHSGPHLHTIDPRKVAATGGGYPLAIPYQPPSPNPPAAS